MRTVTPRPVSPFARRYLARKSMLLERIERHVELHPTVNFTEADGEVTHRPNSADRNSLDPRVRDMWAEIDQL